MATPFEVDHNPVHDVTTPLKPVKTDWWVTFEKDNPQPPHPDHLLNTYYNGLWRRTQEYLEDLAEEDHYQPLARLKEPPVPKLPERELEPSKAFLLCSWRYIRYMQIYKKLERLNDQLIHPQKLQVIRSLVDSVLGRTLELKHEIVGIDFLDCQFHDDLYQTYKINPDQMDQPIPKYYLYEQRDQQRLKMEVLENVQQRKASVDSQLAEMWADDKRYAEHDVKRAEEKAAREAELAAAEEGAEERAAAAAAAAAAEAEAAALAEVEAAEAAAAAAAAGKGEEEVEEVAAFEPRGPPVKRFTKKEAILILQRMERARQGRVLFKKQWRTVIQNRIDKLKLARGETLKKMISAAKKIQGAWRCYLARREKARLLHQEQLFLGIAEQPSMLDKLKAEKDKLRETERNRRKMQRDKAYEITHAPSDIKAQLIEQEQQRLKEQMTDDIRQWFRDCYAILGTFPAYPFNKIGGTRRIYDDMTAEELLRKREEAKKTTKEQKKELKAAEKEKKKAEKAEKKKTMKDFKKELKKWLKEPGWYMKDSKWSDNIEAQNGEFLSVWRDRLENYNPTQGYDRPMIEAEKRVEIDDEVRFEVDAIMRLELEELKFAIKRKRGKVRKEKGPKPPKKPKTGKDITKNRTLESLYEELLLQGIVVRPDRAFLSDFSTDFNMLGSYTRKCKLEARNSMWNIKHVLKDYVMLPLGSTEIHKRTPVVKSILICGPPGSGKRTLVHALANEMKANIFDVSPSNMVGKYLGAELKMLIHLLIKVGNLLGPTIIFLDEAERMFLKPKMKKKEKLARPNDETQPTRIKGQLQKAIKKLIKPGIRVVVIGISDAPYNAVKGINKFYQRVLYLPRPDYGTRLSLWGSIVPQYFPDAPANYNYAPLAKVSDGYTAGGIHRVMKMYMGIDPDDIRMSGQKLQSSGFPATFAKDLMRIFVRVPFDNIALEVQFEKYMLTTALGKKRKKFLKKRAAADAEAARIAEQAAARAEREKKRK